MPEGLEVEIYRRAADALIGRRLARAEADPRVAQPEVVTMLSGLTIVGTRRIGKLLLLDTDGPVVAVHFGMTGRLIVDGAAPIEQLEYGSRTDEPRWHRLVVDVTDGGSLVVADPRRWARVELDPDEHRFGPDLFDVTAVQLAAACAGRRRSIKSVLLDQSSIAGLGNLCVDEILFTAGLHPARTAGELDDVEIAAVHTAMRERLPVMLAAGGSHRGVLAPAVRAGLPPCPRDATPLMSGTIAGRTSVWCPMHQPAAAIGR